MALRHDTAQYPTPRILRRYFKCHSCSASFIDRRGRVRHVNEEHRMQATMKRLHGFQ